LYDRHINVPGMHGRWLTFAESSLLTYGRDDDVELAATVEAGVLLGVEARV